ncbi:MAG: hypothetical protein ACRDKL_05625, partial [Solirubrobacteraceae bacterium]
AGLSLSANKPPSAILARNHKHGKPPATTVVVGRATVTVHAGGRATVRISLTGAGRRLLAKHHTLRATLQVTVVESGKTVVVAHRTVTFRAPRAKKHHGRRRA